MLLRDNEVKGVDALRSIAEELFAKNPTLPPLSKGGGQSFPHSAKSLSLVPTLAKGGEGGFSHEEYKSALTIEKPDIDALFLPDGQTKAIFFTGKGGVGKTTISCITALYLAKKGYNTLLVTTDPAAHIGEVLDVKVGSEPARVTGNLHAVMVDQEAAFKEYKERVLNEARGKYSEDMLAAMEEELNSPCTEEMAAFDKFVQFIESKDYELVVFDTAPTGHTLRLLNLSFDYAKQAGMMVSTGEVTEAEEVAHNRFRDIIEILKDKNRAVFSLVLYPESTPILESYRAMLDLKNAGIETQLVVANMILPEDVCVNDFFKNRRRMQLKYLREIKERFNLPVLRVSLMQEEIKGLELLKKSAGTLGMVK